MLFKDCTLKGNSSHCNNREGETYEGSGAQAAKKLQHDP